MKSRIFLTAIVAGCCCAQALAATPPDQAGDAWARVPALSTACYSSQDDWQSRNDAAIDAVRADRERQEEVNGAIERKLGDAMSENPMALAQAMQQAMLDDPQNAQKYMERITQLGQGGSAEVAAQNEGDQKFEAESKTVIEQYQAALARASAPAEARLAALRKKLNMAPDTPIMMPDPAWPQWAWAEWPVILGLRDQGYAANCATWWAPTGPIHAYLKRYRDYLVQERIPSVKRLTEEPMLENYRMLSVPMAGWRTTTDYKAAEDYMKMAATMFGERDDRPGCREDNHCK